MLKFMKRLIKYSVFLKLEIELLMLIQAINLLTLENALRVNILIQTQMNVLHATKIVTFVSRQALPVSNANSETI